MRILATSGALARRAIVACHVARRLPHDTSLILMTRDARHVTYGTAHCVCDIWCECNRHVVVIVVALSLELFTALLLLQASGNSCYIPHATQCHVKRMAQHVTCADRVEQMPRLIAWT